MYQFLNVAQISVLPASVVKVCKATRADPILSKVVTYLKSGWPMTLPDPVKTYFSRRDELSIEEGYILWRVCVIVPKKLQSEVLTMLHEGHVGMVKMKMIARSYVWWPGLDKTIHARKYRKILNQLLCIRGSGQASHGHDCILILQVLF